MMSSISNVGDLLLTDEPGFACSKTKLVTDGLVHMRPFNIGIDGSLSLAELYKVPPEAATPGRNRLEPGDILFNNTNSADLVGKSALVLQKFDAGFSNHLNRIRVDQSRVDPRWFAFWLRHKRESGYFTQNATRWVSQAAYKTSQLRMLPITLPVLSQQRRYADLLTSAESIVRMRREAEQKAKEIIPALFLDMFGDPATNPKGWTVLTVGEVIQSAQYGTSTKASENNAGIPMIRMGNVDFAGRLSLRDIKYVSLPLHEQAKYRLLSGDILFNRTNSKDLVGKTGIWRDPREAVAASYFIRVRVNESIVTPDYFWAFMNCRHIKLALFAMARGAIGQSNINAEELRGISIPLPPVEIQRRYARRVVGLLGLEGQQRYLTAQANQLFQSLLAKVFG